MVPGLRLAIARETVAAERESERRKPRIMRRIGEAIGARPAAGRGARRAEQVLVRIVGGLEGEQDPAEPARGCRQQKMAASLRFKARGLRVGACGRIDISLASSPQFSGVTNVIGTVGGGLAARNKNLAQPGKSADPFAHRPLTGVLL